MQLSSDAWEALGFHPITEGNPIEAVFYSIHVYDVQGLVLDDATLLTHRNAVAGEPYSVALGTNVNALARAVSVDTFTDDEEGWAKEKHSTPPYVLIQFGPTPIHSCSDGRVKEVGPKLETSDCFAEARNQLRASAAKVLPSLISALSCTFGSAEHPVSFRPIDGSFFGLTSTKRILHDIRFEAHGSLYTSQRLTSDRASATFERAVTFADQINLKVSRFLSLALDESDPLKRFLYFFLAIEIETHATFATLDHSLHIVNLLKPRTHLPKTSYRFFESQRERFTTLRDRFTWCALCVWTHLTDADIEDFARLKKIRDDIAHGSIATPPSESVVTVARLAVSLQRVKAGA